jgi:protein TonB
MDKTSRLLAMFAASALVVAVRVDAQDAIPAVAASQVAASAPAAANTLPSDPTVAPWVPPGGHLPIVKSDHCQPAYPEEAARASAQGTTEVMFTNDAEGKVIDGAILKSAGATRAHRALDRTTLTVFASCPFVPGTDAQGNPTTTRIKITYVWKIA